MADFATSYVGQLRQAVGSRELLVPAAQVLAINSHGQVLVQRRTDLGFWEIPGGSVEHGDSFRSAAASELREETGIAVDAASLTPVACLSDPDVHVIVYPNGDRTHAFSMIFLAKVSDDAELHGDGEAEGHRFVDLDAVPEPVSPITARVIELYRAYLDTGEFQAD